MWHQSGIRIKDGLVDGTAAPAVRKAVESWTSKARTHVAEVSTGIKAKESFSIQLADDVYAAVVMITAPLVAKIATLEARLAEQQSSDRVPNVSYAGVFNMANKYERGDLITRSGALWLVLNDSQPGDVPGSSPHFKLIVKSGSV